MHNLFLGEFQHHCCNVWGLNIKVSEKTNERVKAHTPEDQAMWLERGQKALEKLSENGLKRLRRGYLSAIAQLNEIPVTGSFTKNVYMQAMLDWRRANPGTPIRIPAVMDVAMKDFVLSGSEAVVDFSKFTVLGKELLDQIQADLKRTTFPSWMARPPHNFGSPSHRKLKADQWRSVFTVSLTITLVRIWGGSGVLEREKNLLRNFCDLVIAVETATRRSTSRTRIDIYTRHMTRYLQALRELFSDHDLVPNHHLSLHLDDCLLLFGPVHAWWAFPFERYNGIMRDVTTNNKVDEMEMTFARYFCMAANLRALASSIKFPDTAEFRRLCESFQKTFVNHESIVDSILSVSSTEGVSEIEGSTLDERHMEDLSDCIYDALLDRINKSITTPASHFSRWDTSNAKSKPLDYQVRFVRSVKKDSVSLSVQSSSVGNLFVLFHPSEVAGQPRPAVAGQIVQIFLHRRLEGGHSVVEPFLAVKEFQSLSVSDQAYDPYRAIEHLGVQLYYNNLKSQTHVLKVSDVVSHFSSFVYVPPGIERECIVVKSLDRVSFMTDQYCAVSDHIDVSA
ncbi:hypothetical protein BV22DRAFT_1023456 [Leucogyrophana mollusca]|uniref:Uncharacterized protein n=1 Tax=Leucogyrophana mollusca TaxID=85980 RepID=A0ACB8B020_9AGAM|nr:hypothetical protein BV22DRAFT_1023456 [Leucogyrophana mollusca]